MPLPKVSTVTTQPWQGRIFDDCILNPSPKEEQRYLSRSSPPVPCTLPTFFLRQWKGSSSFIALIATLSKLTTWHDTDPFPPSPLHWKKGPINVRMHAIDSTKKMLLENATNGNIYWKRVMGWRADSESSFKQASRLQTKKSDISAKIAIGLVATHGQAIRAGADNKGRRRRIKNTKSERGQTVWT